MAIAGWLTTALYQVIIITVFVLYGSRSTNIDRHSGHVTTMYQDGVTMFSVILITVHVQMLTVMEQWTWVHHFAVWASQGTSSVYVRCACVFCAVLSLRSVGGLDGTLSSNGCGSILNCHAGHFRSALCFFPQNDVFLQQNGLIRLSCGRAS